MKNAAALPCEMQNSIHWTEVLFPGKKWIFLKTAGYYAV